MLLLIFYIHTQAYYTEAQSLECIIPNLVPKTIVSLDALTWFSYKQQTIPLIDLCVHTIQRPAALNLGTRISIVRIANGKANPFSYWAFRAENMRKLYPTASYNSLEATQMIDGVSCKYFPIEKMQKTLEGLIELNAYPVSSST